MADTPFRKVSVDPAFGISVLTVAAVTNINLPYKLTGQTSRNPTADVCGDNDLIAGFPASQCSVGEAVFLQRAGYFDTIAKGAGCNINIPFTSAVGGVRVAVVGVDLIQGYFTTTAADGEPVQVRPIV